MASASESQAGAAPLPSCDAMRGRGVAEVALWALTIDGIDADDAAILVQNKITGAVLLDRVTEDKLVSLYNARRPRWAYHECLDRRQTRGSGSASENA